MAVYDQPFEKGDVLTPAECMQMAEDLLQGSNNAYVGVIEACAIGPDEMNQAEIRLHALLARNVQLGIELSREWRELAIAKTEAEQLEKAEAEFAKLGAEFDTRADRLFGVGNGERPWHP